MWFVHGIFVVVAAAFLLFGIISHLNFDDIGTLIASALWKLCLFGIGSLLMWYSLYMLGVRVIVV